LVFSSIAVHGRLRDLESQFFPWSNSARHRRFYHGQLLHPVQERPQNHSLGDYTDGGGFSLLANYFFAALAGVTWYLQFFFFGMGKTKMGRYDFSSTLSRPC